MNRGDCSNEINSQPPPVELSKNYNFKTTVETLFYIIVESSNYITFRKYSLFLQYNT